ncbi:CvpA family protein [Acidiluteibacter ferrifornacis]|jgi:membrane protein required for colicin V production|uniref:CvpA family protein n=1 Tax=Acidiluteibacter ferrifornacis TaxID=2692424 RepID=A0A6N9NHA9_9FLAO|nr:CvpA family protein [Acidiluteibacter ferrifornacis]MBR9830896.1 CvpA family protein [bacterium]NBG64921.1 CvpA family protein [Acidiluteibacter ferrifornacis]
MNYLDIVICIPLAWALYKGFRKGLILEIAALVSLVIGIMMAYKFSDYTSNLLIQYFEIQTKALPLISFILTFLVVVIGIHFLAKTLERIIKLAALGLVNRLAGALFSFLKIGLIISTLLYVGSLFDQSFQFIPQDIKKESLVYEPIISAPPKILPMLKNLEIDQAFPAILSSDSTLVLP